MLVNKEHPLSEEFKPLELVKPDVLFAFEGEHEKKYVTKKAAEQFEHLFYAAQNEGIMLTFVSGYRSYERQREIYERSLKEKGSIHTNKYIAKPGCSEHQTGLAIDVSTPKIFNELEEIFGDTKEGVWLKKNAHRFGFVIRYPKGKEQITGYAYEPWHIRYLGLELASLLYKNNWTLEEYILNMGKDIV